MSRFSPPSGGNGDIVRPGISPCYLKAQDIRRVNADEAAVLLGYRTRDNGGGIWIPYDDPHKTGALVVNGRPFGRLRLDNPTPGAKYLSPRDSGSQLFAPRNGGPFGKELVICEGEFKAISLCEAGVRAVAIGGICSACTQGELIPGLAKLLSKWPPAVVHFLGDADTSLKFDFSREAVKLAEALPAGTVLKLPRIPLGVGGNGIDDCRAALNSQFPAFWETITAAAVPVSAKTDPGDLAVKLLTQQLPAIKNSPGWQERYRPDIIALAAHLEPLPLDDLTVAVKDHLGIKASAFKEHVKSARANAAAEPPEQTPNQKLPADHIILPSGPLGIHEAAEKAFQLLAKAQKIFLRGGAVFHLVNSPDDGLLKLEPLTEQAFRSRIERHGKVLAWRAAPAGRGYLLKADARCSLDNAAAMLASDAKNILPPIATIHACPVLIESEGEITLLEKGYHRAHGGRLVVAGAPPQHMRIEEAVALLLDLISEYDFLTPADKSRAISAIIAPAFKFGELLKAHFPVFVVEADDSQAGKGMFLELIQTIYSEKPSMVGKRESGVGGLDESLSQALINGRPFIQYDNIRRTIESQFLEMVMTCPHGGTVPARVPYRSEVQIRPDRFVFQLSSNGYISSDDMANRSCIIRIRKRRGHAFRLFREGDLLDHIAANQPRCLGAVYCVVTQWLTHGKKASTDLRGEGRFRRALQVFDWIVREIFGETALLDGHEQAQERVANPILNWSRQIALAIEADARLDEPLSASEIFDVCHNHGIPIPGVANDATEQKAILRIGCLMAKLFGDRAEFESEGFQAERSEASFYYDDHHTERKIKKYTFRRQRRQ